MKQSDKSGCVTLHRTDDNFPNDSMVKKRWQETVVEET